MFNFLRKFAENPEDKAQREAAEAEAYSYLGARGSRLWLAALRAIADVERKTIAFEHDGKRYKVDYFGKGDNMGDIREIK